MAQIPDFEDEALLAKHRERWEPIYHACRLDQEGIDLDTFLSAPWHCLVKAGQEGSIKLINLGMRPLLPRQARVARRIRNLDMVADQRRSSGPRDVIPFPGTGR